jgi:beta-phosphoglucomutase-like phosphatase (HAD superfamily)
MVILYIILGIYLGVGFLYALWVWLFRYETFLSIIPNTLFGLPYIIWVSWDAITYKKFSFHELFKHKKAVIFDLDGTIIDSQPIWNAAMENVKKQVKLGMLERNYPPGLNVREKWIELLKDAGSGVSISVDKLVSATKQEVLSTYSDVEAFEGFWDFARYLKEKEFKLALASNTDRDLVEELLKRMDAEEVFDFVITGTDVKNRKPNPQMYLEALKGLGVKARDAVVFEDTVVGSRAATAASIDTVIIWDGETEKTRYPSKVKTFIPNYENLSYEIEHSLKDKLEDTKKFIEENNIEF